MTVLLLVFWLLLGGTLQVLVPAWQHMEQPMFPFLLAVVLYAAIHKKARYFVACAILGGLLEDSLSLAPLGASICAFLVAGGVAMGLRRSFNPEKTTVLMCIGGLCAAAATATMAVILRGKGLITLDASDIWWRMVGSGLLGIVVVPLCFWMIRTSERWLGLSEEFAT